jgi:hypothetical protein
MTARRVLGYGRKRLQELGQVLGYLGTYSSCSILPNKYNAQVSMVTYL